MDWWSREAFQNRWIETEHDSWPKLTVEIGYRAFAPFWNQIYRFSKKYIGWAKSVFWNVCFSYYLISYMNDKWDAWSLYYGWFTVKFQGSPETWTNFHLDKLKCFAFNQPDSVDNKLYYYLCQNYLCCLYYTLKSTRHAGGDKAGCHRVPHYQVKSLALHWVLISISCFTVDVANPGNEVVFGWKTYFLIYMHFYQSRSETL